MHDRLIKLGTKFLKGNYFHEEKEKRERKIQGTIFQRVVTSRSPRVPDLFTSLEMG